MEQHLGYFCRAYVGQDVQANVIARTLLEAELEITRMIRGGAMAAHAVQHGMPDHEPVLVASASGGKADGEMWRYLGRTPGRSSNGGRRLTALRQKFWMIAGW